ncbi:hypothetical protein KTO58_13735 [Chitinophaga pendula]|uniref:putative sensor domain DACNV-containing protein n=1 Tax=Chitinophaga TaxID=79328 RepID=UPI000BB0A1A1|nr:MULTISPECIES: hypothetical protein [Chitinophaga]ASZ12204.1 hypothetical protein CK934_15165 [Chitinophaga sp. MD30]UCJ04766.1 hypothetical protein KTO58_13735 [Chitinophaga pendula]
MNEATYRAAKAVAGTIEAHFVKHIATATENGERNLAVAPAAHFMERIIDVAFWASLQREEGIDTRISLAFLPPSQAGKPLLFQQHLPLTARLLGKLSPGVERAGLYVGIWHEEGELYIWGTTNKLPHFCFVLDVSEPGLLVVKHRHIVGLGKFTNVAMLRGDQVKLVDESCGQLPDSPAIVTSLLGLSYSTVWNNPVNVLIQIAVTMRAHKRGGTLLVTPKGSERWRASIVHPLQYPVFPAFAGVADLVRKDNSVLSDLYWQNALRREVENMAGLTAIDGATLINDHHELLAFGAKISRAHEALPIERLLYIEPVIGGEPVVIHPSSLGGTRHLSAAQFVQDQPDSIALVASQDGYFTVFSWAASEAIVQAHRIDILLL